MDGLTDLKYSKALLLKIDIQDYTMNTFVNLNEIKQIMKIWLCKLSI